jgi:hypothetical protein
MLSDFHIRLCAHTHFCFMFVTLLLLRPHNKTLPLYAAIVAYVPRVAPGGLGAGREGRSEINCSYSCGDSPPASPFVGPLLTTEAAE